MKYSIEGISILRCVLNRGETIKPVQGLCLG